jgi:N-methylhydantoinase B
LVSKGAFDAPAGSQVIIEAPGGGGYGEKAKRAAEARAVDAADGYVG